MELLTRASGLSRVAPTEWDFFIKALERRAQEATEYMLGSDTHNVQTNQGRAQAYVFIWKTCKDCLDTLNKIEQEQARRELSGR
jgi:hypothetical protein